MQIGNLNTSYSTWCAMGEVKSDQFYQHTKSYIIDIGWQKREDWLPFKWYRHIFSPMLWYYYQKIVTHSKDQRTINSDIQLRFSLNYSWKQNIIIIVSIQFCFNLITFYWVTCLTSNMRQILSNMCVSKNFYS